jgi:hypothetical protein
MNRFADGWQRKLAVNGNDPPLAERIPAVKAISIPSRIFPEGGTILY